MKHTSAELKEMSRNILSGKWALAVALSILYILINGLLMMIPDLFAANQGLVPLILQNVVTYIATVIGYLFSVGVLYFYLNICRGNVYSVGNLFAAFRMNPDRFLILAMILSGVQFICTLPIDIMFANASLSSAAYLTGISVVALISSIISIIMNLFFVLAPFLMLDFPEMGALAAMKTSAKLMRGNKGRYFYLVLSFMGLLLLGLVSCGLAFLWLEPYINMTTTYFYADVLHQLEDPSKLSEIPNIDHL